MSHEGTLLSCLPPERHSECLKGHSHHRDHPVHNIYHCLSRHLTEPQTRTPGRLWSTGFWVAIVTLCLLCAPCTLRVPCSQTALSASPSCHFPILTVIPGHTKLHTMEIFSSSGKGSNVHSTRLLTPTPPQHKQ